MPDVDDRFLNLALLYIGEAVKTISENRQRDRPPGVDYRVAQDYLRRAGAALGGEIHNLVVDPQNAELGKKGS